MKDVFFCCCCCLTESAVVLPRALHGSVLKDLQVEAGPAVKLPPPQDAAEVRQLYRRRERAVREALRRRGHVRVQEERTGSRDGDV